MTHKSNPNTEKRNKAKSLPISHFLVAKYLFSEKLPPNFCPFSSLCKDCFHNRVESFFKKTYWKNGTDGSIKKRNYKTKNDRKFITNDFIKWFLVLDGINL